MKKGNILPILLIAVSICLAVLAYIMLPDTVVMQFSAGSSGNSTAPKLQAILLPLALGIGGAAVSLFTKSDDRSQGKSLLISVVGVVLLVIMIAVNLIIK